MFLELKRCIQIHAFFQNLVSIRSSTLLCETEFELFWHQSNIGDSIVSALIFSSEYNKNERGKIT